MQITKFHRGMTSGKELHLKMQTRLLTWRGIWFSIVILAWTVCLPYSVFSAASPSITAQPQSFTNGPGTDASFTVVASGQATLLYQWSVNGTNLVNSAHIGGATNATLTVSNLVFTDAGIYRVLVSNTHGSVTSSNAALGVQRVVAWGNDNGGQCDVPVATSNAVALSVGLGSVTLRPDGTVFAWGSATYSDTNVPATLSNIVSITPFGPQDATLAVKADGTVAAWGGTVQPPPGLSNVLAVAGAILNGTYASIALRNDGTVAEWDGSGFITNDVAAGLSNIVDIAAGVYHFLAIQSDGTVVAWGGNNYGETNVPTGLNQVVQVSGGYGMSLALKSNGDLVGWGTDYYGILANAPFVHNVAQIVCNPITALALLSDGTMSAWGNNTWGALNAPVGLNSVMAIAADYQHDLAIIGGRQAPQLYQQPVGLTALANQSVLFKASAVGNIPLRYQWRCNGTNLAGATMSTLLLTNLQPAQAGLYSVTVTNLFGTVKSSDALLTAIPAAITSQPQDQTVVTGSNAVFSVATTGATPLNYQWYFNGTMLTEGGHFSGVTSTNLFIAGVLTNDAGSYQLVISNSYGSVTSALATLTVLVPPTFSLQPTDQSVVVTSNVTFTAEVFGTAPLAYEWQRNSARLTDNGHFSGASTAALTIAGVQANDAGSYRLVVSNVAGVVTSSAAALTVTGLPSFLQQPQSQTSYAGSDVIFQASASGLEPLSFQWQFNGGNLSGATNATLVLPAIREDQAGNYRVMVSNAGGSMTSSNAVLTVQAVVGWGANPYGQLNFPSGLTGIIAISVGGNHVLALRSDHTVVAWGDNTVGQCNVPFGLNNVVEIGAGAWSSVVLKADGTVVEWGNIDPQPAGLSNVVSISVGLIDAYAQRSDSSIVSWGGGFYGENIAPAGLTNVVQIGLNSSAYTTIALNSAGKVFVWGDNTFGEQNLPADLTNIVGVANGSVWDMALRADGTVSAWGYNQEGESTVPPGLADVTALSGGYQFSLALTASGTLAAWGNNNYGQLNFPPGLSNVAVAAAGNYTGIALLSRRPPQFVQPPAGLSSLAGKNILMVGRALGRGGVAYQWKFNGTNLPGATWAELLFTNVAPPQSGLYSLVASNAEGIVESTAAAVSILAAIITNPPQTQTIAIGGAATFGVGADSTAPLAYQWQFGGLNLDGATNASLTLTNVQSLNGGNYTVVVSNSFGSVTSAVAELIVALPPTILIQPQDQTADSGADVPFSAFATGNGQLFYQWYFNGTNLSDSVHISGSSSRNLTLFNVQPPDWGNYFVVVTNWVGATTSSVVTLNLFGPPVVVQQPKNLTVAAGDNAVLSAGVAGTLPLAYQWFFAGAPLVDDGRITGSTTASLHFTGALTNDTGGYQVLITNSLGSVTSSVAAFTVVIHPSITLQPVSQIVAVGSNVTFAAQADGSSPLNYQWYFNGTALADSARVSGSASLSLTISNSQSSDSGGYTLVVTNAGSSATSAVATLSVFFSPAIAVQPVGRSVPLGLPTTISASPGGTSLSYQWRLNGTNVAAATNTSYSIASVGTNDTGNYQLVVSNAVGVAISSNAWLTIGPVAAWGNNSSGQALPPPGLSNVVALAGGTLFSLALKGDGSVTAWGSGAGTNVPAGLSNVVAIAAGSAYGLATLADGSVVGWGSGTGTNVPATVSNVVSVAGSSNHGLGLRREGTVVEWGTTRNIPATPVGMSKLTGISDGNGFSLAVRSDGSVLQWGGFVGATKLPSDFIVVPGLTNAVSVAAGLNWSLALKSDGRILAWGSGLLQTNVPASLTNAIAIATSGVDQGAGHCLGLRSNGLVVAWGSNPYGQANVPAALSNVIAVAVGSTHSLALVSGGAPLIVKPPVGGTAFSSNQFTLGAVVIGQTPLTYSWSLNGVNLTNATNASFTITNAQSSDAGLYQLTVSNALGVATSVPASVTVMDGAPFLLSFPGATNRAYVGSALTMTAVPAGSGPLDFHWLFNGQSIASETNADLNFRRLRPTNSGQYSFIVSNAFGAVTSSVTTLYPIAIAAWGSSIYGATNVPLGLSDAIAVALNSENAAALRANGTVATWGMSGTNVPAGISNVVQIAPSTSFCLALRADGTVRAWNISAALSNSLASLSNIVAVEADSFAGTFLKPDGTISRILGSGTTNSFPQLTNIVALSKFNDGFAALRADGTVFTSGTGTIPPATATSNVLDIALERTYGGVLKRDGSLQTWGGFFGSTNVPDMIAVCANAGVRAGGTVVPWVWTPNSPALANVPAGLASVGAVDASSTAVLALLVARDFPLLRLPEALNTTALVVSSRGGPQWFGETNIAHDTAGAAQSAEIGNNTASSMRMWIAGPVNVSFWWKVSSETNHDFLSFAAGGVVLTNISGESGWQQCTVATPPGNQILQWTYSKDADGSVGQDAAWVDQLVITPVGPTILAQPAGTNAVGGANVTFTVSATGTPPLSYHWWKDGNPVATTTAPTFALVNVVRSNSGIYSVVITNLAGNATSSNAVLSVHVPQLLGTPMLQPDGSLFLSSSDAGGGSLSPTDLANFQVQVSTNLTDWAPLAGNLTVTNGMLQLQDPDATGSDKRFYRILENW